MKFQSLNNPSVNARFSQAVMSGLATDGGLFYPASFPHFNDSEFKSLKNSSLQNITAAVLEKWMGDEFNKQDIRQMVDEGLNFDIPLKKVGPYWVLELFHGPTLAFKDFGVRILAQIMKYILKKEKKQIVILTATSGDTGAATAQGFGGVEGIRTVILFPKGKVSPLQEEQMTRVATNVFPIEVEGVFDDCQTLIKKSMNDKSLKEFNFTSANSLNIGRLIPQIAYYIYTYILLEHENIEFVVPSGNAGNLTACLFSRQMGLNFTSVITACNANDAIVDYYRTGKYNPKKTITTLSSAMDIGSPNNFSRILTLFNNDHQAFTHLIKAVSISDEETVDAIKKVYKQYNYLLDPHTAVAWSAANRLSNPEKTTVIMSTASPVKFANEIKMKTGISVDDREEMQRLQKVPSRKYTLRNDYQEFKKQLQYLLSN